MTTTLTGLAYEDVLVQGGFIPVGAFQGNNLLVQADYARTRHPRVELRFWGRDELVRASDVYGGAHLFGAGGRAGIRYQW